MKKFLTKITILAIVVPVVFSSCATIFGKSTYPVIINTNPAGATVVVTDKNTYEVFRGQAPVTVPLKSGAGFFSKAAYQVKISHPGYAEQIIPVNFTLNGWYFGNLLIGGVLGMLIIDPATGAMWKLDTPPLNVTLYKPSASNETPALKIIDIANVSEDMKQHLVRIK